MFSKPRAMEMRHEVAKQEVRNVVKAIASIGKFWYAHPETNASLQGINMVRSINMARSVFVLIRLIQTKVDRLESDGIEKTRRFDQHAIAKEVDVASRKNQFDLILPDLGPYTLDYTASGRYMVAPGRKGHVTLLDLHTMKPIKDVHVRETGHDVVFLHNELLFATAQKKCRTSLSQGTEKCKRERKAAKVQQCASCLYKHVASSSRCVFHNNDMWTLQLS
ncbi:probable U3 small nucleolar RNA-associated protein 7 [Tanacetum coccineum]|uniref:Probable U3 small nucleolar RNA-associated protein 7 n=1 Tax=Tanacetum coccineum TaxID=301880 RepID=A0ABQ5DI74_9ASTR